MNAVPHLEAVTGPKQATGWGDLIDELDRWAEAARVARLWWRDDDAVRPTPQLDRLLGLADGVPIGLAVIPASVEPGLAERLVGLAGVAVLQHGWRHANHARHGKKSEYPPTRNSAAVAAELVDGRVRLAELFGAQALPIFVPPWNRFAPEFVPLLPAAGFGALSAMAPIRGPPLPSGIADIDVHVDPVAWKDGSGFIGTDATLGRILGELRNRRLGDIPVSGAIGILTHHLIMDDPTAAFIARLRTVIREHRAAQWIAPEEMLPAL
jgi:hypothetical protein